MKKELVAGLAVALLGVYSAPKAHASTMTPHKAEIGRYDLVWIDKSGDATVSAETTYHFKKGDIGKKKNFSVVFTRPKGQKVSKAFGLVQRENKGMKVLDTFSVKTKKSGTRYKMFGTSKLKEKNVKVTFVYVVKKAAKKGLYETIMGNDSGHKLAFMSLEVYYAYPVKKLKAGSNSLLGSGNPTVNLAKTADKAYFYASNVKTSAQYGASVMATKR